MFDLLNKDKKKLDGIYEKNIDIKPKITFVEVKCAEELGELSSAILKNASTNNRSNVLEEMADVYITLAQLTKYYGITEEEIKLYIDFKLGRTKMRLKSKR